MDSDSEQMFHDLEQRHVLLRKEHDVVCSEREAFKGDQNIASTVRNHFELLRIFLCSTRRYTALFALLILIILLLMFS
jgi:hypothetical protein